MSRLLSYISIVLMTMLISCEGYQTDEFAPSKLVVEGWIEADGYPVVMLSRTLPIGGTKYSSEDIQDYLVRWAKVTVSDGVDTVILTGKPTDSYFPPYIYTTGRMKGEVGKTYYLTVEYKDYHATAQTTIPPAPVVESYSIERIDTSKYYYRINARLKDNPDEKNYYQFFTRVGTKSRQFIASYLGSVDDAVAGTEVNVPVYRGHTLNQKYTPYFSIYDTVAVKCSQVDSISYQFWDAYLKKQTLSDNFMFATYSNIPTNIQGGIGYWCGYGSTTSYFVLFDYFYDN